MAHNILNVGRSQQGKSSLAEALCQMALEMGIPCLVYDPTKERKWRFGEKKAEVWHNDILGFIDRYWKVTGYWVFVEEYGVAILDRKNRVEEKMILMATTGRHQKNTTMFSPHRLSQFKPTGRDQCPELYLFACKASDGKALADDYSEPLLANSARLPKLHFYHLPLEGPTELLKINPRTLAITEVEASELKPGLRLWTPSSENYRLTKPGAEKARPDQAPHQNPGPTVPD
jgi:hypothetical protein